MAAAQLFALSYSPMSFGSSSPGACFAKMSMMKDGTFARNSSIFCWHTSTCRFAKIVSMDAFRKRILLSMDRQLMYCSLASLSAAEILWSNCSHSRCA